MNNRLKSFARRLDPIVVALVAIPALLYIPVLYYSLNTPFALVDDYILWRFIKIFGWFDEFLYEELIGYDWIDLRYRPFWEFYTGLTWKVFGPVPWLHHLTRWATHFGAVAAFAAAFLCFVRRNSGGSAASHRLIRLLPLMTLVYIWIFFPNQPAAKLNPQEVQTVFFLGICVWMTALMLLRQGKPQSRRSDLLIYAAFCVSFCGLTWSKEPNIAASLWLLASYYALLAIESMRQQDVPRISVVRALKGISVWKALGGLPLIAVFLRALVKLYVISLEEDYGTAPITPDLLIDNAAWILGGLFQIHTSLIITAGLALLSAAMLPFIVARIAKKHFSDELIFVLFLLGLAASLYIILCTSWAQVLRYWYILIPVFTTLLAFSTKFLLEFTARYNFNIRSTPLQNLAAYTLTAFIAFFVCCNYYNFMYQTVLQHISRHNEANLIAEMTRLLDQYQYVQISDISYGYTHELTIYFHEFLPWFYGRSYTVHGEPPQDAGEPHYIVRHFDTVDHLPEIEETYRPLTYAYHMADVLQAGDPYALRDAGSGIALWQIYDDKSAWIWWNGDALDVRQLVADAGNPIIQSDFDVYLNDRWLIYTTDQCGTANLNDTFFIGVFPVNKDDLPEARKPHGFENFGFEFADHGFSGERCFALQKLPEYPIQRIHAGQFVVTEDGYHNTWEAEVDLSSE